MKRYFYNTNVLIIFLFLFTCFTFLYAQPVSNRSDITLKILGPVPKNSVRIKKDPSSGNLYILENKGNISRLYFGQDSSVTLSLVYQTSDYGLSVLLGMALDKMEQCFWRAMKLVIQIVLMLHV